MVDGAAVPTVLRAGRFRLADRAWSTVYSHVGSHALHLHGYRGRMRCAGVEAPLRSGIATLSPRGVPTAYDLDEAGWHWCVHFRAAPGALAVPGLTDLGPDAAYARARLARLAALHETGRSSSAGGIAAGAALLELLAWLALHAQRPVMRQRSDAAAERAAALIRAQPERDWRGPDLARRVGVSPNWLAARFRARFGMTVDRYRLTQRVELARLLLGSTTLPVAAIGARVGLPDAQHFNKVFRAVVGLPPSACRS